MSDDHKRLEYEGPIEISHYPDDWGSVEIEDDDGDMDVLGTWISEQAGLSAEEYKYNCKRFERVKITVEIIEIDPPPPPPDPVEDFEGPPAPDSVE